MLGVAVVLQLCRRSSCSGIPPWTWETTTISTPSSRATSCRMAVISIPSRPPGGSRMDAWSQTTWVSISGGSCVNLRWAVMHQRANCFMYWALNSQNNWSEEFQLLGTFSVHGYCSYSGKLVEWFYFILCAINWEVLSCSDKAGSSNVPPVPSPKCNRRPAPPWNQFCIIRIRLPPIYIRCCGKLF